MEEIELVIKIPNEIRLALINNIRLSLDQQSWSDSCIKHAIVTGIMLPKGHGRIIDENEIPGDSSWDFADRLNGTPTIVETDIKEE